MMHVRCGLRLSLSRSIIPFRRVITALPHFDSVLGMLATPFLRQADTLLDLRECALRRVRPGRCVACYFALSRDAAAEEAISRLFPLRRWLEGHIEVVAHDDGERTLEALPLLLDGEDLETYCREVMAEFQQNRAYASPHITLSFRFRPGDARAA